MKPKYYHGYIGIRRDANGDEYNLLRDDPVLEGCKCEEERRRLKEEFRAQKIDLAQYDEARKKTLKRERNQRCFPPVLIEMSLKHGDLVVMHGADLQKFYEVFRLLLSLLLCVKGFGIVLTDLAFGHS